MLHRHMRAQLGATMRFAPVKPAIAAGIRGGLATLVPLVVGHLLGLHGAQWSGLAGFTATLADKGGAYRTRAASMVAETLAGIAVVVIGSLAGANIVTAIAATLIVIALCSFARVWGGNATSVGVLASVLFVVALAQPTVHLDDVLERCAFVLAGSIWAMILSLLVWPVRLYWPARRAASAAYLELAAAADRLVAVELDEGSSWAAFYRSIASVRAAIEDARATLAATRRGRSGESARGERLLIILEGAEQLFSSLIAVADLLESRRAATADEALRSVVTRLANFCRDVATDVDSESRSRSVDALAATLLSAIALVDSVEAEPLIVEHLKRITAMLRGRALPVAEAVSGLNVKSAPPVKPVVEVGPIEEASVWQPVVQNLSFESVALRHAVRVAIAAALAVALSAFFHLDRGYWMTLSAIIILQPYADATVLKGLQRVLGTILGGAVAALVAGLVHDPTLILVAVFVFAVISLSVLPVNYALYSFFTTPTFVLLAEVNAGDWHLVGLRITNTLLGGLLAFVVAATLWPASEKRKFPEQAAAALRACMVYLQRMGEALQVPPGTMRLEVADARRRAGLALTNADAALQRVISERGEEGRDIEAFMTITTYARKFAISTTALGSVPRQEVNAAAITQVSEELRRSLDDVAAAMETRQEISEDPRLVALVESLPSSALRLQVERLAGEVAVLRKATARLSRTIE